MFLFSYCINILKHSSFENLKISSHFLTKCKAGYKRKTVDCAFIGSNWFNPYFSFRVLIRSVSILVRFQAVVWSESTIALSE